MRSFLKYGAILSISSRLALAVCPCGYIDDKGRVWREAIETDFTQNAGAIAALGNDWIRSTDTQPQDVGPNLILQYQTSNVFQHNDALGIKTSAYNGGTTVYGGEIFTTRADILHGTFRMRAVVPEVPGVIFGFFSYINDSQEQDIEFITAREDYYQYVEYTNQPGQLPNGDVDTDAHKPVTVSGADFTAYGEHRFDWLPATTNYFYNQQQKASVSKNVPTLSSQIVLNVWSNGDPNFSQGPPTQDAIATVQYVKLYFNSTSLSETTFNSACTAAGNPARCSV